MNNPQLIELIIIILGGQVGITTIWELIKLTITKRQERLYMREKINYLDKLSLVMNNTKLVQGEVIRLYQQGLTDSEIMTKMKEYIQEHKINEINTATYLEIIQWQLERIHLLEVK